MCCGDGQITVARWSVSSLLTVWASIGFGPLAALTSASERSEGWKLWSKSGAEQRRPNTLQRTSVVDRWNNSYFDATINVHRVIHRIAAFLLLGSSFTFTVGPAAEANTESPVRWNTGISVNTTSFSDFEAFFVGGEIVGRALQHAIRNSGWTAEELRFGFTKTYEVDFLGVSRFLYSQAGEAFLKDQTRSYVPYWREKTTAASALRAAIIADAGDGSISALGIMKELPVDFRLADNRRSDGKQNVCAPAMLSGVQATSLLSWYVFLPACVQAKSALGSR